MFSPGLEGGWKTGWGESPGLCPAPLSCKVYNSNLYHEQFLAQSFIMIITFISKTSQNKELSVRPSLDTLGLLQIGPGNVSDCLKTFNKDCKQC